MDSKLVIAHGGVKTPYNRQKIAPAFYAFSPSMGITAITRRYATCRDAQVQRAQDVQEWPLPCTITSALFIVFN